MIPRAPFVLPRTSSNHSHVQLNNIRQPSGVAVSYNTTLSKNGIILPP